METTKASAQSTSSGHAPKRIIKRYSNRKLYDTRDSRYVTLQQIGEMVRAGEEVQIIDNKTKEDKTEVTLALILSEDLKAQPRSVPLTALRDLIQECSGQNGIFTIEEVFAQMSQAIPELGGLSLSRIGDLGTQVLQVASPISPNEPARNEGNKPESEKAAN